MRRHAGDAAPDRTPGQAAAGRQLRALSQESRYRRLFTVKDELSAAELDYLVDVDHGDHKAIIAVDHLERRDQHADQHAITDALITLVPHARAEARTGAPPHPYTRTHLATHAAQAGCIDGLLADPAYLLTAARLQLLASLGAALSLCARSAADAYRRAAPHLRAAPAREHASYLQLAARCGRRCPGKGAARKASTTGASSAASVTRPRSPPW